VSEEQTIISPAPEAPGAERTQVAFAPAADVTQAAIVVTCPVCQTVNPPGDRWCQDCGFLLSSPAPEVMELPAGASGPRLVQDGREFELRLGENRIGRVAADVLLADPTVSRHHATLTIAEDGAWLEDAGSTNGTFLDGVPLAAGSRAGVQDGTAIKFGSVTTRLVWPEGATAPPPAGDAVGAGGTGSGLAREPAVARLVAADGREHAIQAGVTTLGRRGENMIVVGGDPYVSGRHAEIRCDAGGCVLVDVGSTNGTFLRGGPEEEWERLAAHDPRPLSPGVELRLGQSAFSLQAAPAPMEEPVSEGAEGITEDDEPTQAGDEDGSGSEQAE
jgi:pSer/pThr/pTyr-binding forkhead associated (FHA) protein